MRAELRIPPAGGLFGAGALPPRLGGGLPLLGHALTLGRDPLRLLMRGYQAHGEVFELPVAGKRFVMLVGPEAHDVFFRASEEQLCAKTVYRFTVPIFGRGVAYDAPREVMAEQLGFLYPALRDASMREHARLMREESLLFADALGEHGVLDLDVAFNELTTRIASRCLLGREIRARVDADFARWYHDLQGGINALGFLAPRLPTPAHRRRDRARLAVAALIAQVMAARRREARDEGDLLHTLMQARYADGRGLSDDEIAGILITALFAGQHTSGVLATWTGVELLSHPAQLERVRVEVDATYAPCGMRMDFDTLRGQLALERAVRECERLHPPLIILIRAVRSPLPVRGRCIPAGCLAAVSPLLAHRLPEVFADPERFDPDRFAPPREEDRTHRYTLIGFGGGMHRCMGMHFAYLQIKAMWTVLLARFDLELDGAAPVADYGRWVSGPKPPCRVRYRRRTPVTRV
jgi:sterol 14-demethylase